MRVLTVTILTLFLAACGSSSNNYWKNVSQETGRILDE